MTDPRPPASPGRLEQLMFRRIPLWLMMLAMLAGLIVLLLAMWLARHPEGHGRLGGLARQVADVPQTLKSLSAGNGPPVTVPAQILPAGFAANANQPFVDPGHLLVSHFDASRQRYVVRLLRLSDGKPVHEYLPDIAGMIARSHLHSPLTDLRRDRGPGRHRLIHPLLMADGGLILHDQSPLLRIDACGRIEWMIDGLFHHSIERGADDDLWASFTWPRARLAHVGPQFREDGIAHVSLDGRLLSITSIARILDRNGLGHLWRSRAYADDPFHLNDIEPVVADGPHWKRGDLFLSLRSISMVMLYRPSTGRVLWWRAEPWSLQHDVAILDDHRISIFDNAALAGHPADYVRDRNHILIHDFSTDRTSETHAAGMSSLGIATPLQGRATPLDNGDFMVEETLSGRLVRIAADGTLRWRYIAADARGRRYMLGWSRYLGADDAGGIARAKAARCD